MRSLLLRLLKSRRAWVVTGLILGGIIVLSLSWPVTVIWDGSWDQEEYRFTFLDKQGKPVEGIELQVEDQAGSNFNHFPVTDYLPGKAPASGRDGVVVFHHAPWNMVSEQERRWLFGLVRVVHTP